MDRIFTDEAWVDFMYWLYENRKNADKISRLLDDISRNGAEKGLGKPERLRHKNAWSRRIDEKNRLIYRMEEGKIRILSCLGHYDD